MDLLNAPDGFDIQLLTLDASELTKQFVLGDVPTGKTAEVYVRLYAKSRDITVGRIIAWVRIIAFENMGALEFFGGDGNYTNVHEPVVDSGLEGWLFTVGGEGTSLSISVTGVEGEGDIDWYLSISSKKY